MGFIGRRLGWIVVILSLGLVSSPTSAAVLSPGRVPGRPVIDAYGYGAGFEGYRPGWPFARVVVGVSPQVYNDGSEPGRAVCWLTYGSQIGVVRSDELVQPHSDLTFDKNIVFPRPIDVIETDG